jgi:hypothetical protein
MRLIYDAYSPADEGELIARGGELELPDGASQTAIIGALVNAVERNKPVAPGEQCRVIAWRPEDLAEDARKVLVSHVWDHGPSGSLID